MTRYSGLSDTATLEALLRRRHSTRAFEDTEVPDDLITRILELAQRTATWCNAQPWHVRIVRGETLRELSATVRSAVERRDRSFDITPPLAYEGLYADRRRICAMTLYESLGIQREDRAARYTQAMKNYEFFGAPQVAFVTAETALGDYAYVDVGAYMSTFILAAESVGVATIVQGAVAEYSPTVRDLLGIPETELLIASIGFGYEDAAHPVNAMRTDRAPLLEVVVGHSNTARRQPLNKAHEEVCE